VYAEKFLKILVKAGEGYYRSVRIFALVSIDLQRSLKCKHSRKMTDFKKRNGLGLKVIVHSDCSK
jgi:hypothetical protein